MCVVGERECQNDAGILGANLSHRWQAVNFLEKKMKSNPSLSCDETIQTAVAALQVRAPLGQRWRVLVPPGPLSLSLHEGAHSLTRGAAGGVERGLQGDGD